MIQIRILAKDVSLSLYQPQDSSIQNTLACTITGVQQNLNAHQSLVQMECGSSKLLAKITKKAFASLNLTVGTPLWAQVKTVALAH
jgi:molybdate transport system ATP-binding protein